MNVLPKFVTWGTDTYRYDLNGNITSGDRVRTYKWDAENRLIEVGFPSAHGDKVQYAYDGLVRRILTTVAVNGVNTTTRNLWCPGLRSLGEGGGSRIC